MLEPDPEAGAFEWALWLFIMAILAALLIAGLAEAQPPLDVDTQNRIIEQLEANIRDKEKARAALDVEIGQARETLMLLRIYQANLVALSQRLPTPTQGVEQ